MTHVFQKQRHACIKELLAHLQTGYRSLDDKLEDYRKTLREQARVINRIYGNLGLDPPDGEGIDIIFTIPTPEAIGRGIRSHFQIRDWLQSLSVDEELKREGEKVEEKAENLFKEIAGELTLIFHRVEMGPRPLRGFCDCCPHLNVAIEK